jgi:hypothetical protein
MLLIHALPSLIIAFYVKALIAGFSLNAYTQMDLPSSLPRVLIVGFSVSSTLTICIMLIVMISCSLMHVGMCLLSLISYLLTIFRVLQVSVDMMW